MKKLLSADLPFLHILKARLEGLGIHAELRGEHLSNIRGVIPFATETQSSLWVSDTQFAEADEFLRREESLRHELRAWSCKKCGEINAGNFTDCWSCLSPKD